MEVCAMCHSLYRHLLTLLLSLASSVFAGGAIAQLQPAESEVKLITQIVDQLAFGAQVLQLDDPASARGELPGLGHKFQLFGVMMKDTDPENMVGKPGGSGGGVGGNEGISAVMTPTSVALAFRSMPPGIKIAALDNQLGFKHYFVAPRTCGGGSPRLTLLVDANGDGKFDQSSGDFAAHGHPIPFQACPPDKWKYEDLTDDGPRWEVTPGGAVVGIPVFPFSPWEVLETAIMTQFPNHKVLAGFLVDDSCSFFPDACGKAHYDLVTIENRTLEIWQDAVRR
jgi:hypothetical protein